MGLGLILGASVAAVAIWAIVLRWSLPQTQGTITVQGLTAPVTVTRDSHGVPHIEAQSLEDALYGLGFVHGQDRLWQMELTRRTVAGRLAEIAGPPAVIADIYLRSLGLYRAAESAASGLEPGVARKVDAYAAGVTAAMRAHQGPLPLEFTVAQVTPTAWTRADSVAAVKSLALQLSANAFREAMRVALLKHLTPEQLDQFHPPFPPEAAKAWSQAKAAGAMYQTFAELGLLQGRFDLQGASNNWVVSGARSRSGKPIVANDPHLGLTIPSIWYLARLTWPGGEAVGGTVPGIPGIVSGRTRNMAFGLTTTGGDTQDLFVERLDPSSPGRYLAPGGPVAFHTRTERIKVRFGADRLIEVKETAYGPVIPGVDPRVASHMPKGTVLALRWPALDAEDRTIETSIRILEAKDASAGTMRALFASYRAPMQSWVYAGSDGSFGKLIPGPVPVRDPAMGTAGVAPSPGWTLERPWTRLTVYDEWPHERNAADGWFATANNKVVADSHPHKIASEWDSAFRFRRIEKLLAERAVHDVESFKAIQRDVVDEYALEVLPLLRAHAGGASPKAAAALKLLEGWDGAMRMERPEPLIFAAWTRALSRTLMADEMADAFPLVWNYWPDFTLRILRREGGAERWCDDTKTADKTESCSDAVTAALETAVREVEAAQGSGPAAWRWDRAHVARLTHMGLGVLPGFNWLLNARVPLPGGAHTIDRADHRLGSDNPYAAVHGGGFKGVFDLGQPENSAYVIATGQSGNVYSRHYLDLMPVWAKGEYIAVADTPRKDDPEADVLTLSPAP
jgi:penicillin amidase